jgi:CRP-like cAMP-binding protein
MPNSKSRLQNQLLTALFEKDRSEVTPRLVDLRKGAVLAEPYTALKYVYFPHDSLVSLVSVVSEGNSVEIAMVASEGLIGASALLHGESIPYRAVVQVPGGASRIEFKKLKRLFEDDVTLRHLILRYLHALMAQIAQSAICNRFHTIDQRLARWILSSRDRTRRNSFPYTQEFLAQMLGVDRPAVTIAAGLLKRASLIDYRRGTIAVIDEKGLEKVACECYPLLKREFQAIWGRPSA